VPVSGMIIRRSMAKRRDKNRPVAAPEQADRLIIQAICRRFTGTSPSSCLILRSAADLRIKKPISGRPEIGAQPQLWIFS
jgi:hypothetical protein